MTNGSKYQIGVQITKKEGGEESLIKFRDFCANYWHVFTYEIILRKDCNFLLSDIHLILSSEFLIVVRTDKKSLVSILSRCFSSFSSSSLFWEPNPTDPLLSRSFHPESKFLTFGDSYFCSTFLVWLNPNFWSSYTEPYQSDDCELISHYKRPNNHKTATKNMSLLQHFKLPRR